MKCRECGHDIHLRTAADFAKILGVSPSRIRQLIGTPGFPTPDVTASGYMWELRAIRSYVANRASSKGGRSKRTEDQG